MSYVERDTCLRCNVLLTELRIKNEIIEQLQDEIDKLKEEICQTIA